MSNTLPTHELPRAPVSRKSPGWPEIIAGAVGYAVLVTAGIQLIIAIPDEQNIARGIVSFAVSAAGGAGAFAIAALVRIRGIRAFGLRAVSLRWLLIGGALGIGAYLLNILVAIGYALITGDATTPQGDYGAAASGGLLAFVLSILFGAIATPIGEELLFRGVFANALSRYGAWVAVLGSSAVFALAHGINVILPIAFVVGLAAALLLRKTGSIWPGVAVHAVNNGLSIVVPAVLALSATS